ncbi:MAG: dehypoxanthine futalosine cyclase [Verrucomicrobia bacterium]|nr:dehypoxanthine futalosine cyclase [Verrucomicrobiota bacterium]
MQNRISFEQGLELFQHASLDELKQEAQKICLQKHPQRFVTFVLDSNPNYTNICNADCSFCGFYRKKSAKDAYFKTVEEVMTHFEFAKKAGIATVLLQGGVHDQITLEYLTSLVKTARERYPEIHPHFFSAVEIWNCAKVSGIEVRDVLQALWDAGQRTLPGGGAEILSERVRLEISPKKMTPNGWMEVHAVAHEIGFKSTATMMYGHVEEAEDILIHLESLRAQQDRLPGFTSFVPWSYKRDNTALRRKVKTWAGRESYLRIIAFARLYLDNFDHVAASWFSEGREIGMEALQYGANDFGGILLEENVHRATNFINKTDHNDVVQMIREAGFIPAQRNSFYQIIRTYEGVEEVAVPIEGKVKEANRLTILQVTPPARSCV